MLLVKVHDVEGNFKEFGFIEGLVTINTEFGCFTTLEVLTFSGRRVFWSECCLSPIYKEIEYNGNVS